MFLSNRLRVASTLILSVAAISVLAHVSMAQGAAQLQPPLLSVNDPKNPLHYTAQQQTELFKMKLALQNEALELKSDKTLTEEQKEAKFNASEKSDFDAFKAGLSPQQTVAINNQVAKQTEINEVRRQYSPEYQNLQTQLTKSLSDSQKAKVKAINTQFQTKSIAIREGSASTDVKTQQLNALGLSVQNQLDAVFTPAQKSTITQMNAVVTAERSAEQKVATSP